MPSIRGSVDGVYGSNEPIGFEVSGNSALFKGRFKLTRNKLPFDDGSWHLFDLDVDPGETRDLREKKPNVFREMLKDYTSYAQQYGVLEMPENYDIERQVVANACREYFKRNSVKLVSVLVVLIASLCKLLLSGTRLTKQRKHEQASLTSSCSPTTRSTSVGLDSPPGSSRRIISSPSRPPLSAQNGSQDPVEVEVDRKRVVSKRAPSLLAPLEAPKRSPTSNARKRGSSKSNTSKRKTRAMTKKEEHRGS